MKPLLLVLSLLRGADAGTTLDLMHHAGAHEANPLMPGHAVAQVGVFAGVTVAQDLALLRLSVHHPRVAKVIAWTSIVVEGVTVFHNARQY